MNSLRSEQIKHQLELKKKGLRLCYACKQTQNLDAFRITFNNPNSRARCCRVCESKKALERHHKRMKTLSLEDAIRYKIYQAKSRTKKKTGREFNLSHDEVLAQWNKQEGLCYYTGIKMTTLPNHENYFSIDRYDSSRGYSQDNVVLCCHIVNLMKKDMTEDTFNKYCSLVCKYRKPSEISPLPS